MLAEAFIFASLHICFFSLTASTSTGLCFFLLTSSTSTGLCFFLLTESTSTGLCLFLLTASTSAGLWSLCQAIKSSLPQIYLLSLHHRWALRSRAFYSSQQLMVNYERLSVAGYSPDINLCQPAQLTASYKRLCHGNTSSPYNINSYFSTACGEL